ncbi:hypothetical protein [Schaalia hyovaginalis]|uniref:hypothetical protein n=1 Tax=Schaalia hyovaginalis TaxID=29316 RepID=UPI002A749DC6|nr:hypothetical protein [Schaalia hyovaginalis]MDY2669226.1 hypothetical protein [Schaalia hyovaginalis]
MPTALLDTPRAKSALFALVFAPAALALLGSSMADIQAQTAIGLPLSSVEGMISLGLAAILIALVSANCEESSAGMFVTAAASVFIGVAQYNGHLRIPLLQATFIDAGDMRAAIGWSLYPFAVTVITSCAAIALHRARHPRPRDPRKGAHALVHHRHAWGAIACLPAALGAIILITAAAPEDTSNVPAQGLSALSASQPDAFIMGAIAALLLGSVALMSPFSLTGPQAAAWFLMAMPSYMLWPLWTSITGAVVTPGPSALTSVSLAAPVVAALGLLLGASTLGVYWARMREARDDGDAANAADSRLPVG